jgi:serine phosphatase RsbU (regulator of sigma subunit)/anti-sigma regulatory factor (Ser/Thr protein kinase)
MRFGLRAQLVTAGSVVLVAVFTITLALLKAAESRLEEQAFDQLRSVRSAKANQIEAEVRQFLANLDALANSRAAAEVLPLAEAFSQLRQPIDRQGLKEYYSDEFARRSNEFTRSDSLTLIPRGAADQAAQTLYIVDNPRAVGAKDGLDDAKDGSDYSAIHKEIHPALRSALDSFGAYDIFLIDDRTGHIVYSVFKEIDFGTTLKDGPHADSGLAQVWRAAVRADEPVVQDFGPYVPSYGAPAAFAAQGIYAPTGERLGTIAMQAPIDRINAVMSSNREWAEVGLGESGETYIVADDNTLRNDSRFLIEDPERFYDAVVEAGLPKTSISQIKAFDSTIGLLTVDSIGTRAALNGESGSAIFPDYRGVDVLSDYGPLDLPGGLTWAIMSEIDAAEAFATANEMRTMSFAVLGATGVLMFVGIWVVSGRIVRPLRAVEAETDVVRDLSFAAGDHYDTATLDHIAVRRDEVGDLAGAFSRAVSSLEENVKERVAVEGELNVAADIQRSLLPLTFPIPPNVFEFHMHAKLVPAKEVGGDFYDVGEVDGDHYFFLVGDVSGKGVPAALFMAATKTLIRSGAMSGEPLDELMTRINAEIQESNTEFMFATVWIGVLDVRTGEVTFVNAGHNPPLMRRGDESFYVHESHGPFIGPVPGVTYTTGTLTLEPGDRLLIYSDGVTEAMAPDDELFGEDRLAALELPDESSEATRSLVDSVLKWEQGVRSDDVTVLIVDFIRRREERSLVVPIEETDAADAITSLNAKVDEFAEQHNLSEDILTKVQTSLDDIIMNIMTHGQAESTVVEVTLIPGWLRITVRDNGSPFDPLSLPTPDVTLPLEEREPGGLGVHLVRNVMDEVEYGYRDGYNVLKMSLKVPV